MFRHGEDTFAGDKKVPMLTDVNDTLGNFDANNLEAVELRLQPREHGHTIVYLEVNDDLR